MVLVYGDVPARGNPAVKITFEIPYVGDDKLFGCRPLSLDRAEAEAQAPHGLVKKKDQVLWVRYICRHDDNPTAIRDKFDANFAIIQQRVALLNNDVENWNRELERDIQKQVSLRRASLQMSNDLVAGLGYPLRKRGDVPSTYAVADVLKRVPLPVPVRHPTSKTTVDEGNESTIPMDAYEDILKTMSDMALVLERSPSAFRTMGEEDLRWQFLVALNGLYEGRATGETFNAGGKTDILIRDGNANLFVAECKFWGGEKLFLETVDQLLGYLTWRDTKTAILVFNKNKGFTAVLDTIRTALPKHARFRRSLSYNIETGFRAVFTFPSDPNREVLVTVLAFDVPS